MGKDKSDDQKNKLCISVFKSGRSTTTKEIYTQKWVEMINTLERRKMITYAKSNDKQQLL